MYFWGCFFFFFGIFFLLKLVVVSLLESSLKATDFVVPSVVTN